jgi:uncharacterized membrane protein
MRRHQLTPLAAFVLCLAAAVVAAPGLARAADTDDAVCAAYRSNWDAVQSGHNLAAMTSAANSISAECPSLRHQANAAVAAMHRRLTPPARPAPTAHDDRAEAHAAADDAAYGMARTLNTAAAYNAYLSNYPNGRHATEANEAVQPPPSNNATTATTDTSSHITLAVCDKYKTDISVALVYDPVGDVVNWRYIGWFVIHPNDCNSIGVTDNQLFFLYAKATDGTIWGNKAIGSDAAQNHCLVSDAAYDFLIKSSDPTCPANAVSEPFLTVRSTVTTGQFEFNFLSPGS